MATLWLSVVDFKDGFASSSVGANFISWLHFEHLGDLGKGGNFGSL